MSAAAGSGDPPVRGAPDPVVRSGVARGRALFNRADFWGSHEALEAAWRVAPAADRPALQGLIQAGAAFHKLVVQDNPDGARRLLAWALDKLAEVPDDRFGLALAPFRAQLCHWAEQLASAAAVPGTSGGSIVGLPWLEWTSSVVADAIHVDAIELVEVVARDRRALLVAVTAGGRTGWGECRLAWEVHGLWPTLTETLAAALLTEPVIAPSELPVVWAGLAANPCAAAGLEAALWDLWARRSDLPLCAALGIPARPVALAGRVVGVEPEPMRASLAACLAAGYRHVLLPARPNADRRVLPRLVADCPIPFAVDLGGAYRPADIKALQVLDGLGAAWLAQPVPAWNLADAITLARWLATPVSLGGWAVEEQARGALELGALDLLEVDPGVCGLTEARRIAELAAGRALPLSVAGTAATTVGAAADLALAAHPGVTLPSEIGPAEPVGDGMGIGPNNQGAASLPEGPGLGVVPSPAWLDRAAVRRAVFRA